MRIAGALYGEFADFAAQSMVRSKLASLLAHTALLSLAL
jgi:hypothetical protein